MPFWKHFAVCKNYLVILFYAQHVGLYRNIPCKEGLSALRKQLDKQMQKCTPSDMLWYSGSLL